MNKAIFIGNLTRDPQLRSVNTSNGAVSVCDLPIAINERRGGQAKTTYAQVTVWRAQAENCARYLSKGKKIAAWGAVNAVPYQGRDGNWRAQLAMQAEEVKFLSGKSEADDDASEGMTQVETPEDCPF
ncbi:MAG: single-stranded DNA-binding protein [Clostridia bacterium]|nr:single-stranded DNA-binding protein [Clostridia bacterium]